MNPIGDLPDFVLEGFLIAGSEHGLSIALPPYVLEIARASVLELEELAPLPGQNPLAGVAVRMRVQRGAGLLSASLSPEIEMQLWVERLPFAVRTRGSAPGRSDGRYEALERRFLASRGIEVAP